MNKRFNPTYAQMIVLGFMAVILLGTILLTLPLSSRGGHWTSPLVALFTATSSTCVTGLVLVDTYSYWSLFGQIVILILIQVGGLGFMTVITMFSFFLRRRIGLKERRLLMQSAGTTRISGVVHLIKRILIGTFIFEGVGALILAIRFYPKMGLLKAIYNGLFHSVSAFCNAGFDIMGKYGRFSSFTTFRKDAVVNLTIIALIVIGGIGFLVWNDICKQRGNYKKYELHTKIVLTATGFLIVLSAILFFISESSGAFAHMTFKDKLLAAIFQAVTPRTAGFNTVSMAELSEGGSLLTMFLMLIGGSPGSTAGGIKTTTLMVMLLGVISTSQGKSSVTIFKRRIEERSIRQASAIVTIYMAAVIIATLAICFMEPLPLKTVLFEVISAIGTVGLSEGITGALGTVSRLIIIFLMFAGRIGGLTLVISLAEKRESIPIERPVEKILIG